MKCFSLKFKVYNWVNFCWKISFCFCKKLWNMVFICWKTWKNSTDIILPNNCYLWKASTNRGLCISNMNFRIMFAVHMKCSFKQTFAEVIGKNSCFINWSCAIVHVTMSCSSLESTSTWSCASTPVTPITIIPIN